MANLWTEFAARDGYAMATNGKECKNPNEPLVAATFEKAKTYVLTGTQVRDREVGGSNPLAPKSNLQAAPHSTGCSFHLQRLSNSLRPNKDSIRLSFRLA